MNGRERNSPTGPLQRPRHPLRSHPVNTIRTCEKIGFRFRIYDFRHTFGTRLGEAGADAFTIMKLMGHSSISISQRYVHPTPERVETAFAQLDAYNEQRAQVAQKKAEAKERKQTA